MSDWASRLNERVTLQTPARVTDELGGSTIHWQDTANLWAEVMPIGATRERARGGQIDSAPTYRVFLRVRDGVNATQRLVWRGRTLSIHSVHERPEMLEILAAEETL